MMRMMVIGAALVLTGAGNAWASERNASGAILAGDYANAERTLVAERRIYPGRPEIMLNLAAIYRQTGRQVEARALYADVLARAPVMMDLHNDRTASSHAIAQAGLSRLTQVASR